MLDITQEVNPDQSFVMGRNGLWEMKALRIWETGNRRIVFDCISAKRGITINGGMGIDLDSFDKLVNQLIPKDLIDGLKYYTCPGNYYLNGFTTPRMDQLVEYAKSILSVRPNQARCYRCGGR